MSNPDRRPHCARRSACRNVFSLTATIAMLAIAVTGVASADAVMVPIATPIGGEALSAPRSIPRTPAYSPDIPLAFPADDFESYTLGPIADQGSWYAPSANADAQVIAGGIAGKSLRVYANAATASSYAAGRVYAPSFGTFSLDLSAPALDTAFVATLFSEPSPITGFIDPIASVAVAGDRVLSIYQRTSAGDGEFVRLYTNLAENTVARLSFDVLSDGSIAFYRDSRLFLVGQSQVVPIQGVPRPSSVLLIDSANRVPRSADGARNVLTIDNLDDTRTAPVDPAGQPDLALIVTLNRSALGQPVRGSAEVAPGTSVAVNFFALNTSTTAASNVIIGGTLPPGGYTMDSVDCGITQMAAVWSSMPFTLAAGASRTCRATLSLSPSVPRTDSWYIPVGLSLDQTDAYDDNNIAVMTVRAGLFASSFE